MLAKHVHRKWLLVIGIGLFWTTIFGLSQVFFSGYHLRDDHQQIHMYTELVSGKSISNLSIDYITQDLKTRLRPLMMIELVLRTSIFGVSFLPQFILRCIEATLATLLGLKIGRQLGFTWTESFYAIGLTLIGSSTMIWFLLGIPEALGFLLFLSAITLMLKDASKGHTGSRILSILCLLLATTTKESFILVIPAFVIWRWFGSSYFSNQSLTKSIRRRWPDDAILTLIMLSELFWIRNHIHISDLGTYGVDPIGITHISSYLKSSCQLFFSGGIGIGLGVLLGTTWLYGKKDAPQQKTFPLYAIVLIACLIIGPQIILYAKSGIFERYLIPARWGAALLLMGCSHYIQNHYQFPLLTSKKKALWQKIQLATGTLILAGTFCSLLFKNQLLLLISNMRHSGINPLWVFKLEGLMWIIGGYAIFLILSGMRLFPAPENRFSQIWTHGLLPCLLAYNLMWAFGSARIFAAEGYAIKTMIATYGEIPNKPNHVIVFSDAHNTEAAFAIKTYLEYIDSSKKNIEIISVLTEKKADSIQDTFTFISLPGDFVAAKKWLGNSPVISQTLTDAGYIISIQDPKQ